MEVNAEEQEVAARKAALDGTPLSERLERRIWSVILLSLLLVIVLRNAWVTEDAYIMFRTIDNFVNGHGLTWNISERVQTFTNPLWTLILSGVHLFTNELFYTSIIMGTTCTLLAVHIMSRRIAKSTEAVILAIIPLIFSKAFIDYSTSGLENPFTFLSLALFFRLYLKPLSGSTGQRLFHLSLIMAMALLNRMDTLLLFAPAMALEFFRLRGWLSIGKIVLGFLPFILWEIFSVLYYGFAFPNTAYAKLNTGLPIATQVDQGFHYLLNSLAWDPLTLLTIMVGTCLLLGSGGRRGIPIAIGIMFYVFYTVRVGGDFMSGRFLAAPLFAATIGIAAFTPTGLGRIHAFAIALLVGVLGMANDRSPVKSNEKYHVEYDVAMDANGIADERGYYFRHFGLVNSRTGRFPDYFWRDMGEDVGANAVNEPVVVFGNIGIYGFYAGPEVHIVDRYALADPLLARLPANKGARIGHFDRRIPAGYVNTLRSGENHIVHPDLALYYDALSMVTVGPIFSGERLKTIYQLNNGHYDHLLKSYVESPHLVVRPLNDLLEKDVFDLHSEGWWGSRHNGWIWGLGPDNHFLFQTSEERTGTLFFSMDSPFPGQRVDVLWNGVSLGFLDLEADVMLRKEIPVRMEPGREHSLIFRYGKWNNQNDPLLPEEQDPVAVRFHEIGIR